ncbi:MAG: tetratricopeptide repeat protein, partial [Chitinophagales bacterium]
MRKQENILFFKENQLDEAKVINNQGNEYFEKYEYDKALNCFETSLKLRLNILGKNHLDVANSYNNIGNTYYYKGLYDKALIHHLASKDIKINILGEDDIALAVTFNGIGICYDAQGLYSKALAYYNKSLDLRMSYYGKEHSSIAQSFNNVGLCYYSKGTFDNALVYLKKALHIRQQYFGEHHWSVAQTFLNMGACFFRKYEYDEALIFYQKSLKLKQSIYGENHPNIAIVLDNMGFCYRRKKIFDIALDYHRQVLEIRQSVLAQDHPSLAISFNNIGNCLLGKKRFEEALDYFQKALQVVIPEFSPQKNTDNPSIQQYMDAQILLEILQSKAACLQEMNRGGFKEIDNYGELSLKTYQLAANLMTQIRRGYKAESTRLALAQKAHEMYEAAIDTAIENSAEDLAFTFAEQGKGMVLLSSFKDIDAQLAANIPQKWLDEAYDLRIALTELDHSIGQERNKVEAERNDEQLRVWRNQHFDYQRKYEELIEKLEGDYPDYFQLKYDVENISIHELQQTLDCETAIIEFFVGRQKTYVFTIGCDFAHIQSIDIEEAKLKEWVEDLIEAIYAENLREYKQLGHSLYEKLLKNNLDDVLLGDIKNLYI